MTCRARLAGAILLAALAGCARSADPARTVTLAVTPAGSSDAAAPPRGAPRRRSGRPIWATRLGVLPLMDLHLANGARGDVLAAVSFSDPFRWGDRRETSAGEHDLLLGRLDPAGTPGWLRRFGGAGDEQHVALATSERGEITLAADVHGTIDLGSGPLVSANRDVLVASFDEAGALRWARLLGGPEYEWAEAVAVDEARNVFVLGLFVEVLDLGGGVVVSGPPLVDSLFLAKLDAGGRALWARSLEGTFHHPALAVGPGGAVVCLMFPGELRRDGQVVAHTAPNDENAFAIAFDPQGNVLWERDLGTARRDDCHSVAVDARGNVFAAGVFDDSILEHHRRVLVKLDPHGRTLWQRSVVTDGAVTDSTVAVDRAGNAYLAGTFDGRFLDVGPDHLRSAGNQDVFITKLRPEGTPIWSANLGALEHAGLSSLVVDAAGAPILAGKFDGPLTLGGARLVTMGPQAAEPLQADDEHGTFVIELEP